MNKQNIKTLNKLNVLKKNRDFFLALMCTHNGRQARMTGQALSGNLQLIRDLISRAIIINLSFQVRLKCDLIIHGCAHHTVISEPPAISDRAVWVK